MENVKMEFLTLQDQQARYKAAKARMFAAARLPTVPPPPPRPPLSGLPRRRLATAVEQVAASHRVSVDDIMGKSERHKIIAARQDAYVAAAMVVPTWSVKRLGEYFGRDHSTLLYAFRKKGFIHGRTAGRRVGPPSDADMLKLRMMREQGKAWYKIGRSLGVSENTVVRWAIGAGIRTDRRAVSE
jgi:hypothetical protein